MAGRVEVLVDRELLRVVVAHRQAGGVAAGDVTVLLAVVELVELRVVAVDEVARAPAREALAVEHPVGREHAWGRTRGGRRGDEAVDREWRVLERAGERRPGRRVRARRG